MSDVDGNNSHPHPSDREEHFLSEAGVVTAFDRMLEEFGKETDRGAILIAADIASEHLYESISLLKPKGMTTKRLKELLNYPGPFANFSSRIDLAYLAGFIPETAHRSLGHLRKLRNIAAHSKHSFKMTQCRDELRAICDLGPGTSGAVANFALHARVQAVIDSIKSRGLELETEIGSNPFKTQEEIIEHLKAHPEAMEALEASVPKLELAFGMWVLLGLIAYERKMILHKRKGK